MGLHRPGRGASFVVPDVADPRVWRAGHSPTMESDAHSLTAAVQPLTERISRAAQIEQGWISLAWKYYAMPEVRFACRQFSNAFSSAKLVLGKREVLWRDPEPVLEPSNAAENKAMELLMNFAGGPVGQSEFLDRMGTYFTVPGDMVAVGAYDPQHVIDGHKFAQWDLWSTSEVRWTGQTIQIRTSEVDEHFQDQPPWLRHVRIWNRHPQFGWESDSPVRSAMNVLELIGLYDDRMASEAMSRLIGAGVWMIPQGMKLPTSTGDSAGGTPQDFIRLLMEIASIAIGDKRSAAARVPLIVEAAAEDIQAAKDGLMDFANDFSDKIGDLQERGIRRWATGVDLPAEVMLGMSEATHWNASLISEDKVQSFVIPSLRRAVGNLTLGWMRPALAEFGHANTGLELWFDPSGIKTRVDTTDQAQWGHDRFMVGDKDTRYATGLDQFKAPEGEELKRQMLLHMAKEMPEMVPEVLRELGIETSIRLPGPASAGEQGAEAPSAPGRQGPQLANEGDKVPATGGPGRAATLSTRRD